MPDAPVLEAARPVNSRPPGDFQKIYDEFQPRIRRYLGRLVGTSEAEDLAQDVFVKVGAALSGFRRDSKLSTWIYRIATNTALDRLRSPSFERADRLSPEDQSATAEEWIDIDQDLARRETSECVREYVDKLPPSYRSVVFLSEDEGLTNQEIAEALGLTLDTVKIRLHRARARLKQELDSGCTLYRDERNELACEPKKLAREPEIERVSFRSAPPSIRTKN